MAEYIDREAVLAQAGNCYDHEGHLLYAVGTGNILRIPAADVKPVVRGKWILPTVINGRAYKIPHCSVCDCVPCGVDENTRFCPNCGARMVADNG